MCGSEDVCMCGVCGSEDVCCVCGECHQSSAAGLEILDQPFDPWRGSTMDQPLEWSSMDQPLEGFHHGTNHLIHRRVPPWYEPFDRLRGSSWMVPTI